MSHSQNSSSHGTAVHGPDWIIPVGTQVVALVSVSSVEGLPQQPKGAVGVVVRAPTDGSHSYRVQFPDGFEAPLRRSALMLLADLHGEAAAALALDSTQLRDRVILQVVIGSQAYGLAGEDSDIDRRGVFLPRADHQWSLYGVPEQIEDERSQECYWELRKTLVLALKGNPNVLECLYSPIVPFVTELGRELLAIRSRLLSQLIFQTYNGYVLSQFKKLQGDLRNHGQIKWKHVMHLIRLLLAGVHAIRHGEIIVDVGAHREELLAIRRGEIAWSEIDARRLALHAELNEALANTPLPQRPDYAAANAFLLRARRAALSDELP
jgi:uncharacterized protein